jgi:TP901 family phage tail tape measure protein
VAGKEVGKIKIGMYVDGDDLANSIDGELGKAEGKAAGRVGAFFTKMAVAGGAAIAATAAKSLFDFSGFQSSMNEVFTLLPGISGQAMDQMTDQVKSFSKEFGVLPDQVVPALYQALSAGVPKDNVFEFLETAQKAAKGGVTDLKVAVDGISSVVNAYGADVVSATKASDLMFTTVRLGKTNFAELSASMFNVTPTAAALGVKLEDVTGALAAMTLQGVPTSVATTQLRQLFVELSKAGTDTSKTFEKLSGKSFKEFIASGKTTQDALQLLERHAKDSGLGINDLFGSVEAGSAALALTGKGTDAFNTALEGMGFSAGATQGAFDRMNTGIGPIFDRLKARGKVALLDLGQSIADFGMKAADGFKNGQKNGNDFATNVGTTLRVLVGSFKNAGDGITSSGFFGVIERIGIGARTVFDFIRANGTPVIAGLAVVLVAALVPALNAGAAAVAAFFSPVILIVGAIALLVAGVVYAYQHFEGFRAVVDGVAGFLTGTVLPKIVQFAGFVVDQFGNLVGFVRGHWAAIQEAIGHVVVVVQTIVSGFVAFVQMLWRTFGDELVNIAGIAWDQIRNIVETVVNIVRGVIVTVLALINGDWGKAWDGIKSILSTAWEFMRETAVNALRLLREVVETGISGVVSFMREVPGRILDALGDLGSLLWDAGVNLIEGFIKGIGSMLGKAKDAAWNVVKGAVKSAWDAVVPGSPSKVGRAIGENFGSGIAAGILGSTRWVEKSSATLMSDAIAQAQRANARLGLVAPERFSAPAPAYAGLGDAAVTSATGDSDFDYERMAEAFASAVARNPVLAVMDPYQAGAAQANAALSYR